MDSNYGTSTAIVKAEATGVEKLVAAQAASDYLARVSVSPDDISLYEPKLEASKGVDKRNYRKSTSLGARAKRALLRCIGRAGAIKPSPRTRLLESILKAHAEIEISAAVFKDIPGTIQRYQERYRRLIGEEQQLLQKIEAYRADYARAEQDKAHIAVLLDYELLSAADRERTDETIKLITGVELDIQDTETRNMLYNRLAAENKRLMEKVEMDFPFAERELGSVRRQMAVIEQHDEEKVRNGFLPAMDKLHAFRCEYEEAKNRADVEGAEADLEGISQRCGDGAVELRAMREQLEAEDEVESEIAEGMKELDIDISPKANEDLMSRMDRALGRDSYKAPCAEEPAIIEAEFKKAKQR